MRRRAIILATVALAGLACGDGSPDKSRSQVERAESSAPAPSSASPSGSAAGSATPIPSTAPPPANDVRLPAPVAADGVSVTNVTIDAPASGTLELKLKLANTGPADVYVLHRPWVVDTKGQFSADPEKVYRFVDHDSLRLLFGPSPVPSNMSVNNPQFPHATLLSKGGEVSLSLSIPTLREYSLFFDEGGAWKPVTVTKCDVIVQYAVLEPGVTVKPSNIDPVAFAVSTGRSRLRAAYGTCTMPATQLQRREGPAARPLLPTD